MTLLASGDIFPQEIFANNRGAVIHFNITFGTKKRFVSDSN